MATRLSVTGLGMVSALGLDVSTACAAARAGLIRAAELKCLAFQMRAEFGKETLDGFPPVVGHKVAGVSDGFAGPARARLLGGMALADLLTDVPLTGDELARTGIHVSLSDFFFQDAFAARLHRPPENREPSAEPSPSALWKQETSRLIPNILARCGVSLPEENQSLHHNGRVGFVQGVLDAARKMEEGAIDRCLVGGIDSCVEPGFLQAAAGTGVLKTGDNPVGFMAGEGAGFVLLERPGGGGNRGRRGRGLIAGATAVEHPWNHFADDPPLGQALATAIRKALAMEPAAANSLGMVISDLNGLERRALDWGHALVRLRGEQDLGGLRLWLPAVSFGETGAAAGPLATCLGLKGFERGYAAGTSALVCLASDNGHWGAFLLLSPHSPN